MKLWSSKKSQSRSLELQLLSFATAGSALDQRQISWWLDLFSSRADGNAPKKRGFSKASTAFPCCQSHGRDCEPMIFHDYTRKTSSPQHESCRRYVRWVGWGNGNIIFKALIPVKYMNTRYSCNFTTSLAGMEASLGVYITNTRIFFELAATNFEPRSNQQCDFFCGACRSVRLCQIIYIYIWLPYNIYIYIHLYLIHHPDAGFIVWFLLLCLSSLQWCSSISTWYIMVPPHVMLRRSWAATGGSRYYVKHRAHNERGPSTWPSRGRGRSRLNVHAMVHCMWMSCIVFEWITMVFRCCLLLIQVWPHHCRIKLVLLCFTPLIPKGSKGLVLWQGCQPKWAMTKLDTSPIGPQTSYRARSKHGICRRPSLRQPGFLSQWMTPVEIDTYITIHNYPLAIGCSFL
jgi:hypothetical protein